SITINPAIPFLLNEDPGNKDASYGLFVFPKSSLEINVEADGYTPWKYRLNNLKADTSIVILMERTATGQQPASSEQAPVKDREEKNQKKSFPWLSILLGVIVLFLLWRLLSMRKKLNHADAPAASSISIRDINPAPSIIIKQPLQPSSKRSYFLAEIMMTAGPRKSADSIAPDRDLGEDVCGFINNNEEILMWVLDGASDYFSERNPDTGREYFSSRLLAQSVAGKLRENFSAINATSFQEIVTSIIESVKIDWVRAINALPEKEIAALRDNILSGRPPECAATILIAKISLSGELLVYRSGDCKLLIYQEEPGVLKYKPTPLSSKNNQSNDWLFFRMMVTENNLIEIMHNKPLFEVVSETGIQTIIGMSDGVGRETVESLAKDQSPDRELLRTKLVQQVQGTGDDKSLCMIEIKTT
ncbi:MAG: hypothetical protein EOO02_21865, partial [Chitinophagaceae bacterium]